MEDREDSDAAVALNNVSVVANDYGVVQAPRLTDGPLQTSERRLFPDELH